MTFEDLEKVVGLLKRQVEKLQESQTELENNLLVRQAKCEKDLRELKLSVLAAVAEDIEPEDVFAPPMEKLQE